jgi:hypothetical protein
MTAKRWRTGTPKRGLSAWMLDVVRDRGSDRQFRLVMCGHLRQQPFAQTGDELRAVELGERLADRRVTDKEVRAFNRRTGCGPNVEWCTLARSPLESVEVAIRSSSGDPLHHFPPLFREVFGNPFRPVTIDPQWRTSTAVALAEGIYDEKAFDRMPILADALQDAGCTSDDILDHCRDTKAEHARGCWVVDLLLAKK